MGASGAATINFGAAPGTNIASATITGQAAIASGSMVEAWIMGLDSTADHNAYEHAVLPLALTLSITAITASTGFVVQAATQLRLSGQIAIRWVWN